MQHGVAISGHNELLAVWNNTTGNEVTIMYLNSSNTHNIVTRNL